MTLIGGEPTARAFTLVEVIAAGIILVIILGGLWILYDTRRKTKTVVKSAWILAPTTIPASPGSGTLIYRVWRENLMGKVMGNVAAHKVTFTLAPGGASAGAVTIESVTDGVNTVSVNALTCTGITDAGGLITVTVQFERFRSGAMTAADAATGQSEPSDTFGLTAF